ncbi:MAG TPA: 23S rRNA (guanosine(2251)-2'-O)-methyltransferase RlmB [Alphaproteobacteria bacterium]|nr:23S rRNA (guanosine(2251)-2'-O)-methyltransferase RlmB [Alphaproteobacteria bacterium]
MAKRKPNRRPRRQAAAAGRTPVLAALPGGARARPTPLAAAAPRERRAFQGGSGHWLFGTHAVLAALANPQRRCQRLLLTAEAGRALAGELGALRAGQPRLSPEVVSRGELDRLLPTAVHQGIALEVAPLEEPTLEEVLRQGAASADAVLVVLDQVTDPHNVGAILRSAAAFGALGVVVTERHAPHASATLAKAASGALESIPLVRVGNLAQALEEIKGAGFWCIGLAADAAATIAEARLDGRTALVLGAEGAGLRRLTRERCDLLVRIPLASAAIASLNVSNAAAVALYELARKRGA